MNPYLALAACLQAGLDGIERKLEIPPSVKGNLFEARPSDLEEKGVERLPETLGDAIVEFEKDGFIRQVLGEHIFTKYLEAKDKEWREFRAKVTDWEVKEYLYKY